MIFIRLPFIHHLLMKYRMENTSIFLLIIIIRNEKERHFLGMNINRLLIFNLFLQALILHLLIVFHIHQSWEFKNQRKIIIGQNLNHRKATDFTLNIFQRKIT